ncbi:hypothetical protein GCM10008967_40150 [Bacillus carboniphilus]|uniref:Uncharacterized protein n=1 Tax=Bacillus carboniphilus TaxID=86663 RepID=A0ABN0WSK0_9BACI
MSSIVKWLFAGVTVMLLYNNRYKIMNVLLGQYFVRKLLIRYSMQIPFLREKFVQGTFKM